MNSDKVEMHEKPLRLWDGRQVVISYPKGKRITLQREKSILQVVQGAQDLTGQEVSKVFINKNWNGPGFHNIMVWFWGGNR